MRTKACYPVFPWITCVKCVWGKAKACYYPECPQRRDVHRRECHLSCGFGGDPAGWEYFWYKDTQRTALPNTESSRSEGSSYTISPAALAHSGEYRCRAERGRNPFYSDYSDPLSLDISVHRAVENVVRICVAVAVLLFLSVIVRLAFRRRVSGQDMVHSEEEMAEQTADA
ncbi:hypothetical protein COCON_G00148470 [Conger conger]|uniref:Ig-like domain-containing protein n=1 Tax=Conger conger TaxID=82655 RepID=A0A9Q1DC52_CONCO|nr:hypothetical protein COCON_G00148470 [Conger conger]